MHTSNIISNWTNYYTWSRSQHRSLHWGRRLCWEWSRKWGRSRSQHRRWHWGRSWCLEWNRHWNRKGGGRINDGGDCANEVVAVVPHDHREAIRREYGMYVCMYVKVGSCACAFVCACLFACVFVFKCEHACIHQT